MTQDQILTALREVVAKNSHFTTWTVSTPHLVALVNLAIERGPAAFAEWCYELADVEQQLGMALPPQTDESGESVNMDPEVEARLSPMLAQAAQQLLQKNTQEAQQAQAKQQAQDPIVQMQMQELQLKAEENKRKAAFYQPAANEAVEILKSLSYVYKPTYKSCARCLHKPTWPDTSVVCGGCRFYSNFRANPPLPVQPEQESNHD